MLLVLLVGEDSGLRISFNNFTDRDDEQFSFFSSSSKTTSRIQNSPRSRSDPGSNTWQAPSSISSGLWLAAEPDAISRHSSFSDKGLCANEACCSTSHGLLIVCDVALDNDGSVLVESDDK